ncbi:MAG TPA: YlxM family DNA-binding protein [Candidatus Agathobaculum stercoravium]|nr:YlxM family DNA-binding protein [Candidatus Agathobaculum stercoravium]
MKGKPLEMSLLFDFYGETLTEKQRELFDLYYNEDLSLAEIAEYAGITRQGVRDSIKRAEHALREMEEKLGLVARYGGTERCAEELMHEVERLRALNAGTLHSSEAEGIASRMSSLLEQLRQEA